MLNASATISLIMLNVSIFLCCVYMSFVEGFSFTYKPVSNFFWPTVRIEHGIGFILCMYFADSKSYGVCHMNILVAFIYLL